LKNNRARPMISRVIVAPASRRLFLLIDEEPNENETNSHSTA
jgi:hypothetical protein